MYVTHRHLVISLPTLTVRAETKSSKNSDSIEGESCVHTSFLTAGFQMDGLGAHKRNCKRRSCQVSEMPELASIDASVFQSVDDWHERWRVCGTRQDRNDRVSGQLVW